MVEHAPSSQSSARLARAVATEIARQVTDVVICPGSRNSPLSIALLRQPGLRVHTRVDERSAAFLALGIARVTRRHVAVVTTSGTAASNCIPAMTEAAHSHTPLLLVTADRPRRLVGRGASQTIDQVGLCGPVAPTLHVDSTMVDTIPGLLNEWCEGRYAVHLNVALDNPLLSEELLAEDEPAAAHNEGPARVAQVDHGEVELDLSKDTLVIAGDEAWEVPGLEDVPTLAEPTAPAPFRPVHPLAAGLFAKGEIATEGSSEYADYVARTKPEQIVVVGHPTLHRPVAKLMADESITVVSLSRTAQVTDPTDNARFVGSRVKVTGAPRKQWLNLCDALSAVAAETVREVLADSTFGFTGLHVAAGIADGLGVGDTVVLGASNPVRDAAYVGLPFGGVDTYSPRGTAGIDGTVSQAVGVALAVQSAHPWELRAPRTVALMGDVTFLHDVGGLLIPPGQPRPENLTIVVANDDGCGIFETLETGRTEYREYFEDAFGTPHGVDIAALCAAYGVEHRRVETLPELLIALEDAAERSQGVLVIEAVTTRRTRRELTDALSRGVGL
ncbi:2-succinyl-5-enolpyruvyl-6-hydroxy-3-cyclohexene-1-carboxylic-acid synthase [Corynebacterium uterequi]|nr:2-succinyl-5-enolpyruvyl-6-hydroxy-3-cyclohexene-1-carboxylic-acid synthase [Corynebacterium uterequi]